MKKVITYGTFDLFHIGHLHLLMRLKAMGDHLTVAVSTDEFNLAKGKKSIIPFKDRIEIVKSICYVDTAIPEISWDQKIEDIKAQNIDIFAIGDDWSGKFDHLSNICEVRYLERTTGISSTDIRKSLTALDKDHIEQLKKALDIISDITTQLS